MKIISKKWFVSALFVYKFWTISGVNISLRRSNCFTTIFRGLFSGKYYLIVMSRLITVGTVRARRSYDLTPVSSGQTDGRGRSMWNKTQALGFFCVITNLATRNIVCIRQFSENFTKVTLTMSSLIESSLEFWTLFNGDNIGKRYRNEIPQKM